MNKSTLDAKVGPLNVKQIMGLVLGFGVAFILSILGWGWNSICFGFMIIGLALYMIPNMMGLKSVKILTVFGTISFIAIILIGSSIMSPNIVTDNSAEPEDNDYFKNISYTYENGELTVTSDVYKYDGHEVIFYYATVEGVGYTGNQVMVKDNEEIKMDVSENTVTTTITLDSSKLHIGFLGLTETIDGEEVIDENKITSSTFLTDAYDGSLTSIFLYGCFMASIASIIVFYLVLFISSFMRRRFENVRDKMEKEGRLYPQGYGRCDSCNSMVLPGEINCRKCGEYIDRPESMKPQKKDFFECSECNAEVPSDAKECPKCGEVFDEEDEIIIQQKTNEVSVVDDDAYMCPECNSVIPATSSFCAKCGRAKK